MDIQLEKLKSLINQFRNKLNNFFNKNKETISNLPENVLNKEEFSLIAERFHSAENQILRHYIVFKSIFNKVDSSNYEEYQSLIFYSLTLNITILLELSLFFRECIKTDPNTLIEVLKSNDFNKNGSSYFFYKEIDKLREFSKERLYFFESLKILRNAIEHPLNLKIEKKSKAIQFLDSSNSKNITMLNSIILATQPIKNDGITYENINLITEIDIIDMFANIFGYIIYEVFD
ncbi:hypothetical protein STURON_00964 [Spiroplasma turonicum]|uniref:Uncharacterized protein n=1 Tax=Spiroplasma turonicum TaxID=216946 RepID=A0A0K1P7D1_9MOLU|nr:hypothetical protein [Spiroplasma turonicum]AKU80210.1 hypothetical protein STURON_00964 [Spiroplasma turonicum]ALX71210.1 hypothetical protein STURO_v1c09590 [Spiroplasma turonicum]